MRKKLGILAAIVAAALAYISIDTPDPPAPDPKPVPAPEPTPEPTPAPKPVPTPTPPRELAGIWALQSGSANVLRGQQLVTDAQLRLPHVVGLTIRFRAAWLAPDRNTLDLSFVRQQVARCRKIGKPYKLLLMTGSGSIPDWIGGQWFDGRPAPWSPQLKELYGRLVAELGAEFANDPLCVGFHITGPTLPSAEMHENTGLASEPGYSDDAMVAAWMASIDAIDFAFPRQYALLSVSGKPMVQRYLSRVLDYGVDVLGDRFAVQHNSIKPDTSLTATHNVWVKRMADRGCVTGYEFAQPQPTAADVRNAIAIGRSQGGDYFDVYPSLKNLEYADQ